MPEYYQLIDRTLDSSTPITSAALGSWVTAPTLSPAFYNCGGSTIVGRFPGKSTLTRSYSNLPAHERIVLNFDAYLLDTMDADNWVGVSVDGVWYDFRYGGG